MPQRTSRAAPSSSTTAGSCPWLRAPRPPRGRPTLDAGGRTVLPGYIDAHRHIINGDTEQWFREQSVQRMQEFLDAGFTTLMSGGGPMPGIMELKRRIDSGELKGPRVITSGRADPANFKTADEARAQVRALAAAGVEIIKAVRDASREGHARRRRRRGAQARSRRDGARGHGARDDRGHRRPAPRSSCTRRTTAS